MLWQSDSIVPVWGQSFLLFQLPFVVSDRLSLQLCLQAIGAFLLSMIISTNANRLWLWKNLVNLHTSDKWCGFIIHAAMK